MISPCPRLQNRPITKLLRKGLVKTFFNHYYTNCSTVILRNSTVFSKNVTSYLQKQPVSPAKQCVYEMQRHDKFARDTKRFIHTYLSTNKNIAFLHTANAFA